MPGDGATPAIADDAALHPARQRRRGGQDVEHRQAIVDLAAQFAALGNVGGLVAELDAGSHAVEQRRGDDGVALGGEGVADMPHMAVHADFLHHDQGAGRILRTGAPGGQAMAIGGGERDHRHGRFPLA